MAVIIPKMNIPDNCYHCQLEKNFFCTAGKFYVRDAITSRTKHEKCPLKSVIGLAEEIVAKSNMSIDDISTVLEIIDKYCGGEDEKTND